MATAATPDRAVGRRADTEFSRTVKAKLVALSNAQRLNQKANGELETLATTVVEMDRAGARFTDCEFVAGMLDELAAKVREMATRTLEVT